MDLLYGYNGYIQHTTHDDLDTVPMGTLQNTGDNVLALVQAIANENELADAAIVNDGNNAVYYDFMYWFMISYYEQTAIGINLFISTLSVITVLASIAMVKRNSGE